jgi:hypothetical protein
MPYLQIYRNRGNYIYSHTVLKGDDLYQVHIAPNIPMRWKYLGKVDPKVYQVNGILVHKPSIKLISILQRDLQPKRVNESADSEKSVWRSASQNWLKEFIDNEGYIDHKDRFISFSFDPESGGMDNFGGEEVVIEFDQDIILSQAHSQGLGEIEYDLCYMEDHPEVAKYILGFGTKQEYFDNNDEIEDDWDNKDDYWESYIESFEHEKEIVMKTLSDEEGLIKGIVFNKPADISLVNRLRRKGIPYRIKAGLENDLQQKLHFESFQ